MYFEQAVGNVNPEIWVDSDEVGVGGRLLWHRVECDQPPRDFARLFLCRCVARNQRREGANCLITAAALLCARIAAAPPANASDCGSVA